MQRMRTTIHKISFILSQIDSLLAAIASVAGLLVLNSFEL